MKVDPQAIGRKIASGALWTVAMRMSIRMLGFVSVIILARLLVPEDFGIVAKAAMIASVLELIATFGLEAALIHNQRAIAAHYDTVWTIHVIRGAVIAIILVALAQPAAEFFNETALATILWFYGLASLLNGLENVGVVEFRKNLTFDKDFRYGLYRKLAGFVVTISVALVWRNYWAFVAGVVSSATIALIASYLMSPYRPRLSLQEWRSLFDFSKWMFVVGILQSVSSKLDTFILSRFSTTEVVGQYTVSFELSGTASTEIAMPIARATMPGLAQLNEEPDQFRDTYQRTIAVLMLISVPASLGVAAVAYPVTLLLLGENWLNAVPMIEALAIFGIFRAVSAISASAFLSGGRVREWGYLSVVNLLVQAALLSTGFMLGGVIGLAIGVVIAGAINMVLSILVQRVLGFVTVTALIRDIWRIAVAGLLMYFGLTGVLQDAAWFGEISVGMSLVLQVAVGAALYLVAIALLWRLWGRGAGPEKVFWDYISRAGKPAIQRTG